MEGGLRDRVESESCGNGGSLRAAMHRTLRVRMKGGGAHDVMLKFEGWH
jgi:hypothetical protein